jgi:hypothetical protein
MPELLGEGGAGMSGQWQTVKQEDAFQTMLEDANRLRLHGHWCRDCGELCACLELPCAWRPFDRDAGGERWRCGFCEVARGVVLEEEAEEGRMPA